MTSGSDGRLSDVESNSELPEVLNPDEHGTLRLAFYDGRVSDDDAFVMPDPENSN